MTQSKIKYSKQTPDADLITDARKGNHQAFKMIVVRYESTVAATAIGMLGKTHDAEEVGQETFVRFYKAIGQFRGDANLGTYLTRIAINLSLNAIKSRQRKRSRFTPLSDDGNFVIEPAVTHSPEEQVGEYKHVFDQALTTLDPRIRAVVVLRLVDGFSTRETASLLEIPIGTVLSRLARGQARLRISLAPYWKNDE